MYNLWLRLDKGAWRKAQLLNFTSRHIVEHYQLQSQRSVVKGSLKFMEAGIGPSVLCGSVGPDYWQIKLRMFWFCTFSSMVSFSFWLLVW